MSLKITDWERSILSGNNCIVCLFSSISLQSYSIHTVLTNILYSHVNVIRDRKRNV